MQGRLGVEGSRPKLSRGQITHPYQGPFTRVPLLLPGEHPAGILSDCISCFPSAHLGWAFVVLRVTFRIVQSLGMR